MKEQSLGSRIPGFYDLSIDERMAEISSRAGITSGQLAALSGRAGLTATKANHMIENVIGLHALPLGIALNFIVNDREVLVPMAIEEPSVVAGASFMAKLARAGGGFSAQTTPPLMIGQMQVLELTDLQVARQAILDEKGRLLAEAAEIDPVLQRLGGGPRDIEVRLIQ